MTCWPNSNRGGEVGPWQLTAAPSVLHAGSGDQRSDDAADGAIDRQREREDAGDEQLNAIPADRTVRMSSVFVVRSSLHTSG